MYLKAAHPKANDNSAQNLGFAYLKRMVRCIDVRTACPEEKRCGASDELQFCRRWLSSEG